MVVQMVFECRCGNAIATRTQMSDNTVCMYKRKERVRRSEMQRGNEDVDVSKLDCSFVSCQLIACSLSLGMTLTLRPSVLE